MSSTEKSEKNDRYSIKRNFSRDIKNKVKDVARKFEVLQRTQMPIETPNVTT